ncbi:TlpA family protein disulfide reductase [Solitalea longa]|nr:TlpA disulfide reductase family protein [Solitalea longa]
MLGNKVFLSSVLFVLFSTGILKAQVADNSKIDSVQKQTEARKVKYLSGLRKVNSDKELKYADSVAIAKNIFQSDIRFLSQDYQRMQSNEFNRMIETGEYKWIADTYVDADFVIKAKVVRPATKAEEDKGLNELKEYFKSPKALECEKVINSQLGKPAPAFSVVDVNGVKYDLNELKGKVVVLNFWFIGCGPCRKEVPKLNELVEKYKDKEVVFLAFEVNNNTPDKVKAITEKWFKYTQIPTKRTEVAQQYQVKVYPTSYVIDQQGIVRLGFFAYNPFKLPELDTTIESLLKQKPAKK